MGKENKAAMHVEEEFGRFLRKRFPNAEVEYEPQTFMTNGKPREGATPDFRITLPSGRQVFVKVTTLPQKGGENLVDPKSRQKRVMKDQAPGVPFFVFYRETLLSLQAKKRYKNLNLRFFPNGNGHTKP